MPLPTDLLALGPYFSVDILERLPEDGNRYEIVHGEMLVTPAPSDGHQELLRRLIRAVDGYLDRHPTGHLVISPADVRGGVDTLVQPDLFVVPKVVARSGASRHLEQLLLVIEILSPGTAQADRFTKRRQYQEAGVPVYWIVDPEARAVEVWVPAADFPAVERESVGWRAPGAEEDLVVGMEELFRPIE